jgi:hypothetical protein
MAEGSQQQNPERTGREDDAADEGTTRASGDQTEDEHPEVPAKRVKYQVRGAKQEDKGSAGDLQDAEVEHKVLSAADQEV